MVPANPMGAPWQNWFEDREYESNGEQIYFTGVDEDGNRIRSYGGGQNSGGMMMGMRSNLSCVSCHGADGTGGLHTMHMDVMEAPDIRYRSLAGEGDYHGGEEDQHADEHGGYDLDDFRLAVVGGVHPDGEKLSRDMPRWLMSDEDITDLFEFIKSLD